MVKNRKIKKPNSLAGVRLTDECAGRLNSFLDLIIAGLGLGYQGLNLQCPLYNNRALSTNSGFSGFLGAYYA